MKYCIGLLLLFSATHSFAQSQLSQSGTDCTFILPWECETCTFKWSGDCENKLPEGKGILTVLNEGNEIMRYEGEMKNGKFDGEGKYRDAMNELEGNFEQGAFHPDNSFITSRNTRLDTTRFNKTNDWEPQTLVTKQIDNFYFTFPASGYAYDHREELTQKCLEAFKQNCALIHDPDYTEFTRIRFVTSKNEVLLHANLYVSNMADIQSQSLYMLVTDQKVNGMARTNPPITHEAMHLVAMTAWGPPPTNNNWLNEGLATYAQNNCSGYSVAEIYRYFLETDRLVPLESLAHQFYQTEEMISYHQSAFVVEYLISKYGIPKLETFWKNGFQSFESVYGINPSQLVAAMKDVVLEQHPHSPAIDWEVLKSGCE